MANILTKPQLSVNGRALSIVPNSMTASDGYGETKLYAKSAGGNSIDVIAADDLTSRISCIKVHVYNDADTNEQLHNILDLQQNGGVLEVSYSDVSNANQIISGIMTQARIVNDPEFSFSADDGKVELEFKGAPLTRG